MGEFRCVREIRCVGEIRCEGEIRYVGEIRCVGEIRYVGEIIYSLFDCITNSYPQPPCSFNSHFYFTGTIPNLLSVGMGTGRGRGLTGRVV